MGSWDFLIKSVDGILFFIQEIWNDAGTFLDLIQNIRKIKNQIVVSGNGLFFS